MYKRIKSGEIIFPKKGAHNIDMSDQSKDFITRCLEKEHDKRLGSKGTNEVTGHPWLKDTVDLINKDTYKVPKEWLPEID